MDSQKHLSSAWQSPSLPARCTTTFRLTTFPKNHQCLQVLKFSKGTQGTGSGMPGPSLWLPGTTDALFWASQSSETLLCCKSSKIFITARPKSSKSFPICSSYRGCSHRTQDLPWHRGHRTPVLLHLQQSPCGYNRPWDAPNPRAELLWSLRLVYYCKIILYFYIIVS